MIEVGQVRLVTQDYGGWMKDDKLIVGQARALGVWDIFTSNGDRSMTLGCWLHSYTVEI